VTDKRESYEEGKDSKHEQTVQAQDSANKTAKLPDMYEGDFKVGSENESEIAKSTYKSGTSTLARSGVLLAFAVFQIFV